MSFLVVFLSLLIPLATGLLIVSVFWPKGGPSFSDVLLKCCLSVGFGFGSSSCLVFVWMMIVGRLTRGVFILELILLAGLSVLFICRRRASIPTTTDQAEDIPISSFGKPYFLRLAVGVSSLSAAVRFLYLSLQDPHGQFDAYAIWNLRARFLYAGGDYWKHFTYMTWSHPDYPLLVPASIAASWKFIGRETQLIPIVIGLLFTFATVGVVAISISRLHDERQGLLAGLILLGTPFLISHGASQYADVPLSFFFAATVALLFFQAESPSKKHFLILAGMAASFSAWTKNEGILFLVLLLLLHFAVTNLVKGRKNWGSEAVALLMGALPVIGVVILYKVHLAATNDVIAAQGLGSTVPKLLDMSRYHLVARQFGKELFSFGGWSPTFALPLLLFFYFLLLGTKIEKEHVATTSIAVLLPIFMIICYFFVYITSQQDLAWHLESSLSRLLLQVWPLAILAYFAIVQPPEQAVLTETIRTKACEVTSSHIQS